MTLQEMFLSFFGSGYAPKAPGTVGSFFALLFAFPVIIYVDADTLFFLAIAVTIVGIFEVNRYEKTSAQHDPSWIVIDEAAGMWIAFFITYTAAQHYHAPFALWLSAAVSFITFRIFDVWKPSTIGWIDRNLQGGLGVMLDDTLAAFAAGALGALFFALTQRLF